MEYMEPMGLVNKLQRHDTDELWSSWPLGRLVEMKQSVEGVFRGLSYSNSNFFEHQDVGWNSETEDKAKAFAHLFAWHKNMFVPSLECLFASVQLLRFFLQNFPSNEPILLTQGMSRDQSQLIIANKPNKCF